MIVFSDYNGFGVEIIHVISGYYVFIEGAQNVFHDHCDRGSV